VVSDKEPHQSRESRPAGVGSNVTVIINGNMPAGRSDPWASAIKVGGRRLAPFSIGTCAPPISQRCVSVTISIASLYGLV